MKKILYILFLLPFLANGQVQYLGGVKTTVKNRGALQVDSLFVLPKHDTGFVNFTVADSIGSMVMYNGFIYYRDTAGWIGLLTTDGINNKYTKGGDNDFTDTAKLGVFNNYPLVFYTNSLARGGFQAAGTFYTNSNALINTVEVGRPNSSDAFGTKLGISAGGATSVQGTFFGYQAGQSMTGTNSTCIGVNAGRLSTNNDIVAIGALCMSNANAGVGNTGVGRGTMSTVTGTGNTGVGSGAMATVTTGQSSSALGVSSLYRLNGTGNVALGFQALYGGASATGSYNSAMGYNAGQNLNSTSSYNTFMGANSGNVMTTGSYNAIVGSWRGTGFETVSGYTFLSYGKSVTASLGTYLDSAGQLYHRNFPTGASTDSVLTVSNNLVRKQPPYNYYTGWATYQDTLYTSGSPFSLTAATKYTLPNRAHIIIDSQMPIDIDSMYNRTDSTITGREGDGLNIVIEFKIKPTTVLLTKLTVSIDIGGTIGEIYTRDFILTKGSGVDHYYLSSFAGYTLDTWESNGGKVKVEVDNAADIYDIRYVLTRTHKAR